MKLNDFFVDWQGKVIVFEQAENVCTLWSPDGDPQEKNAIKKFSFTPSTASAEIFNKGFDPYNLMDAMQVDKLKTEPKEERTVYHVPLKDLILSLRFISTAVINMLQADLRPLNYTFLKRSALGGYLSN